MNKIAKLNKKNIILALMLTLIFSFAVYLSAPNLYKAEAATYNGIDEGAVYNIENVSTGYVMDFSSSTSNGAVLTQRAKNSSTVSQQFRLRYNSTADGWEIIPMHTTDLNKIVDIKSASTANNAIVQLYDRNNTAAQLFRFTKKATNTYRIETNISSYDKYLGILDNSKSLGAKIVQTSDITSAEWRLVKVSANINIEAGASYKLKNVYTGRFMDFYDSSVKDGTALIQNQETKNLSQQFIFIDRQGDWEIIPMHAITKAIDIKSASTSNNATVQLYTRNDTKSQRFWLTKNTNGSYRICTVVAGCKKYLGVKDNAKLNGEKVIQTDVTTSADWTLIRVFGAKYMEKMFSDVMLASTTKPENHPDFGAPIFVKDVELEKTVVTKDVFGTSNNERMEIKDVIIRYWKYEIPMTSRIHDYGMGRSVSRGVSYKFKDVEDSTLSLTHSQSTTLGISSAQEFSVAAGLPISGLNIMGSLKGTVSTNMSTTFTATKTNKFTRSKEDEYMIAYVEGYPTQSYELEIRGVFQFYVVQIIEFNYDVTSSKSGVMNQHINYSYTFKDYTVKEELTQWDMITAKKGFHPYGYVDFAWRYIGDPLYLGVSGDIVKM